MCLKRWIVQKNRKAHSFIECELCHHLITFQIGYQLRCQSCEEVKKSILRELKVFIFLTIGLVLDLVFLPLLCWMLSKQVNSESDNMVHQGALGTGIAILLVLLCLLIFLVFRIYFIDIAHFIHNINNPTRIQKSFAPRKVFPQQID